MVSNVSEDPIAFTFSVEVKCFWNVSDRHSYYTASQPSSDRCIGIFPRFENIQIF